MSVLVIVDLDDPRVAAELETLRRATAALGDELAQADRFRRETLADMATLDRVLSPANEPAPVASGVDRS